MSRKNKAEKACSAVWKDQSTMAAVAKQKTAQEGQASQGQASQGCGDTVHDQVAVSERRHGCCCAGSVGSSHEVEASRDMTDQVYTRTDVTPLSEDDTSSTHSDDIPQMSTTLSDLSCEGQVTTGVDTESHEQQTLQAPDSRVTGRVIPSPNCYPGGHESLTTPLVAQYGSGSIPPIFELECDGNGDDDVFDINCHGDNDDDDDDESSRDRPEDSHMTHDASQPVDIPRFTVSPHASMPASPDTRFFFPPPGGSVPLQYRLTTGSLMCRGGRSISGQSPLGPDNIMVHEALAWAQRLLSPMQQVGDDPHRVRFTSFNPAPQTTSLMTSRDRSQSAPSVMSRSVLERQFGQELRRISDEFHLAYGMGQLRHAQAARRLNGHRPASFPCNHGNPPGWWQLILAYVSPRQLNHHRRCIMETPTESSDPNDPSLAERDQEEDKDPV